nr:tetratricopeptide repeat protein [Candidatus Eremiobacteraeota bacterium]
VAERPTNLPAQLIPLIGREADVAEIKTLSKKHRVLSIVGAGGIGKTSIALRVGADVLPEFEDGVWLVELAALTSGSEVSTAIAGAFGIASASGTLLDAVISYLKNKTALLIVDNCEHLAGAVATDLSTMLRACPGVCLISTTREPLGIPGECVYRLPSLSLPADDLRSADEISSYGSVALFTERARMHAPGFVVTDANAPVVAQICRRLDGIALAIELAASRLRVLPVEQLEQRLDERFRILTGGSRAALPRQQTMRALIDWSYDLLSDMERTLFSRLAMFAAGCTLGAALEVCADEKLQAWELLDFLTSLVDKSLVVFEPTLGEGRYRLLESTREYATERLNQSGERELVAARHAKYYRALADVSDKKWSDTPAKQWIAPLRIELDNFRAALTWSLSGGADVLEGITLLGLLEAFWWDAQPIEGRRWIAEALPHLAQIDAPVQVAKFWLTAANVALTLRQQKEALTNADRALESYARLSDEVGIAAALRCRGAALINLGNIDEGEACVKTALETFRATGNRRLTALALRSLGLAPRLRGNLESAAPIQREALELARALEDERGIQIMSGNLAEVECDCGNYEEAVRLSSEALQIARARHDTIFVCGALINISAYLIALNRLEEARAAAHEAIDVAREIQSELHLAIAVQHVAVLVQHDGDNRRSARLLGYADAAFERAESKREPTEAREYDGCLHRLAESLTPADLERHLADGSRLDQEGARAEALL